MTSSGRKPPVWVFAGGGTGGHLTPGLAVAAELRRRDPACRIVFVGTRRPVEDQLLTSGTLERIVTPFRPPRDLLRHPVSWVTGAWKASREANRFLAREPVSAVIGLGGYACVPHVRAAVRRGIPVALLEQNVLPGRAVTWLARSAQVVCTAFEETRARLPRGAGVVLTGNPVRQEITVLDRAQENVGPFTLLVLGGSLGATPINAALRTILESRRWAGRPWRIVHQTGPADVARVEWSYLAGGAKLVTGPSSLTAEDATFSARVEPFFTDMPALYRSATLVLSRAGATTLAELACAGLPSILIPYPQATANHQTHNAEAFVRAGAARIIQQDTNPARTGEHVASLVEELASRSDLLTAMSTAARTLARPDAAERVADCLESIARTWR